MKWKVNFDQNSFLYFIKQDRKRKRIKNQNKYIYEFLNNGLFVIYSLI